LKEDTGDVSTPEQALDDHGGCSVLDSAGQLPSSVSNREVLDFLVAEEQQATLQQQQLQSRQPFQQQPLRQQQEQQQQQQQPFCHQQQDQEGQQHQQQQRQDTGDVSLPMQVLVKDTGEALTPAEPQEPGGDEQPASDKERSVPDWQLQPPPPLHVRAARVVSCCKSLPPTAPWLRRCETLALRRKHSEKPRSAGSARWTYGGSQQAPGRSPPEATGSLGLTPCIMPLHRRLGHSALRLLW
jgi:hypothetical protein